MQPPFPLSATPKSRPRAAPRTCTRSPPISPAQHSSHAEKGKLLQQNRLRQVCQSHLRVLGHSRTQVASSTLPMPTLPCIRGGTTTPLVQDLRMVSTAADTLAPRGSLISIASLPVETNGTEAKDSRPEVLVFVMPSLVLSMENCLVSK